MQPIDLMQTTYLAFYIADHGKLLDRTISLIDGSPFSHCELVINDLGNQCYDCISSSHRDGGLRRKNIDMSGSHWVLIPVKCDMGHVLRWFDKRQNFKYNYFGIIRTVIPNFYEPAHSLFCSEACADMLELVDPGSYGLKKLYEWATQINTLMAVDKPPIEL
ncbi:MULTISPECIES: hypothetical protein [unclassified Psychrobacter]|uniref:hypothetical protein n=1 Tax=unclassified Psychrobacter TaxID=196806 RepID=UPI003F465B0D